MLKLPPQVVYKKIIQTGQLAEKLGAKLLGLGAFTSVVGDGGITIAKHLNIPVTTGDSYTVAVAVEAVIQAANLMEMDVTRATAAVVGATGTIGGVCSRLLAQNVPNLLLIGRRNSALNEVKSLIEEESTAQVRVSTRIDDLQQADIVVAVSSATERIIQPHHLRSGAIICDVARPRDVSQQVVERRNDVLVIEGGVIEIPGRVNFNFDFGLPPNMAFACMAETMVLALEQRYENFTLGKSLSLRKVQEINKMAKKHGFKLAGFRSFEKPITQKDIDIIKSHVRL